MRFIVHEQTYETVLNAGKLRYWQDGEPTGAVEQWRYTQATESHTVLRVDLDARAAEGKHSYLYHAVIGPDGRAERINFRFFGGDGRRISGNVLFEDDLVTLSRIIDGERLGEEQPLDGRVFFFPSTIGLTLMAGQPDAMAAMTLDMYAETPEQMFGFLPLDVRVVVEDSAENITVGHTSYTTDHVTISWDDQTRTLQRNTAGWPLTMQRQDGLSAQATQLVNYR